MVAALIVAAAFFDAETSVALPKQASRTDSARLHVIRLGSAHDPEGPALILMSTPAGRLSLLRASIVLLVG
jgi:hypothetical protein